MFQNSDQNFNAREGERPREPLSRKHPSKNSLLTSGFRSNILFVTVCTEGRRPLLACPDMVNKILSAWNRADKWAVGRYVIMPDHVHFFCSPVANPPYDFHLWMRYWKRLVVIGEGAARGDARRPLATSLREADFVRAIPPFEVHADARHPKLWQSGCWDTQMRTRYQYENKWLYVRNNPVRKGLAKSADDWLYQGVISALQWYD